MSSAIIYRQCTPIKTLVPIIRAFSLSSHVNNRRRRRERHANRSYMVDPGFSNVFAQDEMDNLEAMEDFINQDGSVQGQGQRLEEKTRNLIQRKLETQQRHVKKKIMERKYFKQPQEVNLLTWKAKQQICYLHNQFPEEWTPEELAEKFPVSLEGVHRLLRSSYMPRTQEEMEKHDKRVVAHWHQLKKSLAVEGGPITSETNPYQHIIDSGKLPLMINAGGSSGLPMPTHARKTPFHAQKRMGIFESIIARSDIVKAQKESEVKKIRGQQSAGENVLKRIAETKMKDMKFIAAYSQGSSKE